MVEGDDIPPTFTKKPKILPEDDGDRLVFVCELFSKPPPSTSWFRNETKLDENERTKFRIEEIGSNKFRVFLELNEIVDEDAGLYRIKAINNVGEVSASISLNFTRKLLTDDNTFFLSLVPSFSFSLPSNLSSLSSTSNCIQPVKLLPSF